MERKLMADDDDDMREKEREWESGIVYGFNSSFIKIVIVIAVVVDVVSKAPKGTLKFHSFTFIFGNLWTHVLVRWKVVMGR